MRDQRQRRRRLPDVFARLKGKWETWNAGMLAITPEVRTHGVNGRIQADRYHADGTD